MIKEYTEDKIVIEKDGESKTYDVLFKFDCEDTFKTYIGYTDNTKSDDGRKNIYVSSLNPLDPDTLFEDITDEKELDMVKGVLSQLDEYANETNK